MTRMFWQAGRYNSHLLACSKFKTQHRDAYQRLTSASAGAPRAQSTGPATSSVASTNAYYISMSAERAEAVSMAYAEAVFASGCKFGYCTDEEEWRAFWAMLIGPVWRPPSRHIMSEKYVNLVFKKMDGGVRAVLGSVIGGCYQDDGWTGPSGEQVFSVLFGAPLPFYLSSFRISGRGESADTLIAKVKEQLLLVECATDGSWQRSHNTGFVTDSPNVNRSARTKLLEADAFSFAYGCAAHAMSNLCRDIAKLPSVLLAVAFCTMLATFFHGHHLLRAHLIKEQEKETPRPPTMKLFWPTRYTGAARLLTSTLKNRGTITTFLFKSKQRAIHGLPDVAARRGDGQRQLGQRGPMGACLLRAGVHYQLLAGPHHAPLRRPCVLIFP